MIPDPIVQQDFNPPVTFLQTEHYLNFWGYFKEPLKAPLKIRVKWPFSGLFSKSTPQNKDKMAIFRVIF